MNNLNKALLLGACVLSLTSCGREDIKGSGELKTEVRNLAEFTGLDVSGNYEILGTKGSPDKFVIGSNENLLPYIDTSVKSGVVIVDDKKSADLHATVTQKIWFTIPTFSSLKLNGSSQFQFEDLEGSKIEINLSGSHKLLLTGKASELDLTISGSSEVDARNLVTSDAKVVINGSSIVYLNPEKNLNVTINGEGKVVYFSQAPKIEQKINGAGQVISNFGGVVKDVPQPEQKY